VSLDTSINGFAVPFNENVAWLGSQCKITIVIMYSTDAITYKPSENFPKKSTIFYSLYIRTVARNYRIVNDRDYALL